MILHSDTKCICFISPHPATNILNWSGTLHSIYRSLEAKSPQIKVIGFDGSWLSTLGKSINRVLYRLGYNFDCRMTKAYAICIGLLLSCQLSFLPSGPIVAVAASNCVPYLITRRRIVYISDATFRSASKIYPEMKALPAWLSRQCDQNEARALQRADFVILPSKWAINSAILDYGLPAEKLFQLPFGANIDPDRIEEFFRPKTIGKGEITFLFASADWHRKGGDKAIAICQALRDQSIDAKLTILGPAPDYAKSIDFVHCKGFLRKSNPSQLAEICETFRNAHFLLLPTLADASPIVFAEAQAFGTPPITHDVGGTGSSIKDGTTGLMFPIDSTPNQISEKLIPYCRDFAQYEMLSRTSREWFIAQAQWSRWSDLIFELCGIDTAKKRNVSGATKLLVR